MDYSKDSGFFHLILSHFTSQIFLQMPQLLNVLRYNIANLQSSLRAVRSLGLSEEFLALQQVEMNELCSKTHGT